MYIYNVTININEAVHDNWLFWMKEKHIPDMLNTGKFSEAKMSRVMIEEDMGGITYSVQYTTPNRETLDRYYNEDAERLRQESLNLFKDQFVAFRTELEVIQIQKDTIVSATEHLFVYGTLLEEEVQDHVFSRKLEGSTDILEGHKIANEKVAGLYPTLRPTGNPKDRIEGKVFVVSPADLSHADQYEGAAYTRVKAKLSSGIQAWVYLGKNMISG